MKISFLPVLYLLLYLGVSSHGHHVVFKNIGQLAGALSYIHAKVGLNLTSLEL
jgi:hypothetical protein